MGDQNPFITQCAPATLASNTKISTIRSAFITQIMNLKTRQMGRIVIANTTYTMHHLIKTTLDYYTCTLLNYKHLLFGCIDTLYIKIYTKPLLSTCSMIKLIKL